MGSPLLLFLFRHPSCPLFNLPVGLHRASRFSTFFRDKLLSSLSPILSYRRDRTLSLCRFIPFPQTRPRSVDPFRLVLSPPLLLAVEIAVTNRARGIQEITKRALPFARDGGRRGSKGSTCKPIFSRRSILTALRHDAVEQSAPGSSSPASFIPFHRLFSARGCT